MRTLLRQKQSDLNGFQRLKLQEYFTRQPTIKVLYEITQELMDLMNEKMCKYKDCKQRLVPKLLKFIERLKECGFELFRKLGRTMEYWQEEIGRMFRFTRTNSITEGWRNKNNLKMLFLDDRRRSLNERTSESAVIEFSEQVTEASEARKNHRKMKLIQRQAYGFRLKRIIACVFGFYVLKLIY